MPLFNVCITVTREYITEIEADSEDDARELAENMSVAEAEEEGYVDTEVSVGDIDEVEEDDEACPGCGCKPGDGVTATCFHPDGCGFSKTAHGHV